MSRVVKQQNLPFHISPFGRLAEFFTSEEGLETVEWLLVLGGVIVPLTALIFKLMGLVARYYSFDSWIVSLPFP
jgi:hypothetical protein